MDLNLNGKKVILSGGSRGIGRAIAEKLLAEGAVVAFFARGIEGVENTVSELSASGKIFGSAVDAADHQAVRDWVVQAVPASWKRSSVNLVYRSALPRWRASERTCV